MADINKFYLESHASVCMDHIFTMFSLASSYFDMEWSHLASACCWKLALHTILMHDPLPYSGVYLLRMRRQINIVGVCVWLSGVHFCGCIVLCQIPFLGECEAILPEEYRRGCKVCACPCLLAAMPS